jgi:RND family efflux transporter MFP subunit
VRTALPRSATSDATGGLRRSGRTAALLLALAATPVPAADPVPVTIRPLAELTVEPAREAPATVLSVNEGVVAAEIAGRVLAVAVRVGDLVEREAPLATIDCRDRELERQRAEAVLQGIAARLDFARFQLGQARSLSTRQNVSRETLAQRESEVALLQAQQAEQEAVLALAGRNVDKCAIRAPFRALVKERLASEGEWRNPGEPLVRLVDMSDLEVSAQVGQDDAATIAAADTRLRFVDGGQGLALRLRTVLPAVDARARTREARLVFAGEAALPGTPGRLVWQSAHPHLPADLLVRRSDALGVFTVADGQARFVAIPGALEGRPAATDLAPDTPVVTDGRQALRDGDPVSLAP